MSEHGRRRRHRTVDRVVCILEAAARAPGGVTVAELARTAAVLASFGAGSGQRPCRDGFSAGTAPALPARARPARPQPHRRPGRPADQPGRAQRAEPRRGYPGAAHGAGRARRSAPRARRRGRDSPPRAARRRAHGRAAPATAAGRLLLAFTDEAERRGLLDELARHDAEAVAEFRSALPAIRASRISRSEGLADPEGQRARDPRRRRPRRHGRPRSDAPASRPLGAAESGPGGGPAPRAHPGEADVTFASIHGYP